MMDTSQFCDSSTTTTGARKSGIGGISSTAQYNGLEFNGHSPVPSAQFSSSVVLPSAPQYNGLWNSTDICPARPFNSSRSLYSLCLSFVCLGATEQSRSPARPGS